MDEKQIDKAIENLERTLTRQVDDLIARMAVLENRLPPAPKTEPANERMHPMLKGRNSAGNIIVKPECAGTEAYRARHNTEAARAAAKADWEKRTTGVPIGYYKDPFGRVRRISDGKTLARVRYENGAGDEARAALGSETMVAKGYVTKGN